MDEILLHFPWNPSVIHLYSVVFKLPHVIYIPRRVCVCMFIDVMVGFSHKAGTLLFVGLIEAGFACCFVKMLAVLYIFNKHSLFLNASKHTFCFILLHAFTIKKAGKCYTCAFSSMDPKWSVNAGNCVHYSMLYCSTDIWIGIVWQYTVTAVLLCYMLVTM